MTISSSSSGGGGGGGGSSSTSTSGSSNRLSEPGHVGRRLQSGGVAPVRVIPAHARAHTSSVPAAGP